MTQNVKNRFIKFVSQNVLGMMGISFYILADTFFISLCGGSDGITALNLVLPVYGIIYAIGAMIGTGGATKFRILRAQGKAEAEKYFGNAVLCAVAFALPFMAVGAFVPERVIALLGGDADIIAVGTAYTRIFMLLTPCFMLNYVFNAFVRNDDAPSLAMAATLASSLFNVVFDYLLMFPCKMGMAGAALATGLSPVVGMAVCSAHFLSKKNTVKFIASFLPIKQSLGAMKLGITAFIGELSSGIMTIVFNFIMLSLAGNIGVASYAIVANGSLVAVAVFNGIAQGAQPLLSEYYGKKDKKSLNKVLRMGIITSAAAAVLIYVAVFVFAPQFTALFNHENSAELAEYSINGIRLYFTAFVFAGFNIIGTGYLSATEKAAQAFVASIMRAVVAIIGFAFLLSYLFGMNGVWLSFTAAEALTAVVTVMFIRRPYSPTLRRFTK